MCDNKKSLLQQIGTNEDFEDEIIDLKNSYYNSFNDWDELNYMQFLINYDEIKRLSSPPYYYPELITTFKKFTDTDKATTEAIENYALENHTGGRSVFDESYFMDVYEEKKHEYSLFTQTISSFMNEMKAIAAQRKEAALEELLNTVDLTELAIANLIGQLQITDVNQTKWLYANTNEAINIINFLKKNSYRGVPIHEAVDFVKLAIANSNGEYLEDNFDLSKKSPFKVDMTKVLDSIALPTNNSLNVNKKFLCIYKTLVKSSKFKTLFINTFGVEDNNMNIKFEIVDLPMINGVRESGVTDSNLLDVRNQTIKLDKSTLISNHPLVVAQTIIHEALHAFINVKQVECLQSPNATTTYDYINSLNQLTFDELLNDFYLDCDVNQPEQHRLMYNRMVNALDEMLTEVFTDLVAPKDQGSQTFIVPTTQGPSHVFNWTYAIHYLNLAGLQEAKEYKEDILANPIIDDLANSYIVLLNDSTIFNQNICNE